MKVLFISDTHGFHKDLKIPADLDMIIHGGDWTNSKNPVTNYGEAKGFLEWYDSLKVTHKILIAGNHDTSIEAGILRPDEIQKNGIVYLEHGYTTIDDKVIFGSPYTPEFCGWAFNIRRDRLHQYWEALTTGIDLLVTHGPPKGIMDIADKAEGGMEYCGDRALLKKVQEVKPRLHLYGHIHDNGEHMNQGTRVYKKTTFINGSCVTDRKFNLGCTSHGIIINL